MGEQKEWDAKRAVLVTRNLQAIEGILQEPSSYPRPRDKRPASPTRESPSTQYRERETKGSGRESSRTGEGDTRHGNGAGKKGERLTSEGSIPGGRSSWDDYHGHPKSRPDRPGDAEMNVSDSHYTEMTSYFIARARPGRRHCEPE